jgi:hypothetical protein
MKGRKVGFGCDNGACYLDPAVQEAIDRSETPFPFSPDNFRRKKDPEKAKRGQETAGSGEEEYRMRLSFPLVTGAVV